MPALHVVPNGITCTDWESAGDTERPKRCKYITKEPTDGDQRWVQLGHGLMWRGQCQIQARLICEEWLKVHPEDRHPNAEPGIVPKQAEPPKVLPLPQVPVNLLGEPIPEPEEPKKKQVRPKVLQVLPGGKSEPKETEVVPNKLLEQLERDGIEIEIQDGKKTIFFVANRTEQDRTEVTFAEVFFMHTLLEVFPGAKLVALRRPEEAQFPERRIKEIIISDELVKKLSRLDPSTGIPKVTKGK